MSNLWSLIYQLFIFISTVNHQGIAISVFDPNPKMSIIWIYVFWLKCVSQRFQQWRMHGLCLIQTPLLDLRKSTTLTRRYVGSVRDTSLKLSHFCTISRLSSYRTFFSRFLLNENPSLVWQNDLWSSYCSKWAKFILKMFTFFQNRSSRSRLSRGRRHRLLQRARLR